MKKGVLSTVVFALLAFSGALGQTGNNCVSLQISSEVAVPGNEVCLDVTTRHFSGIAGLQFSILWDTGVLGFTATSNYGLPGLTGSNFAQNIPGVLAFAWSDSQAAGVTLPDDGVVFSICFDVVGGAGQSSSVRFADAPTPLEVVSGAPRLISTSLIAGGVFSGSNPTISSACASPADGCADSEGDIEITVSGGAPPYLYSWTGPDGYSNTVQNPIGIPAGVYELTVADQTGATTNGLFLVTGNPPMVTATSSDCQYFTGNPTVANVSTLVWQGGQPPYIFQWNTGETDTTAQVSTTSAPLPFTFQVTITDANGCVHIPEPFTPHCDPATEDLIVGTSYNCAEVAPDSFVTTLTALAWSGAPPYQFAWSNGFTEQAPLLSSITVPFPGVYAVTVTDQNGAVFTSGDLVPDCSGLSGDVLYLSIGHAAAGAGDQVCLPVSAVNFESIASLQLTINWNPEQLLLTGIQHTGLLETLGTSFNFGYPSWQNGQLLMSWLDATSLGVTLPDSVTLFELCFEAIGEGLGAVALSHSPVPIEASNGNLQLVPVEWTNGWVSIDANRVWPGDTDHNGVVNQYDLLPIGLGYGAAGPARPNATLDWAGQPAQPWLQSTQNSLVNYMHLDADGNGQVGAPDTLGMSLNWALETDFAPQPGNGSEERPVDLPMAAGLVVSPIYVEPTPVQAGQPAVFKIILGAPDAPGNTVYGLAFSIVYDPALVTPESVYTTFSNSWIGVKDQSMITFYRNDPANHRIHVAMTRIDGQTVTGSGQIGQLHVTIEDVIFKGGLEELVLAVENAVVINNLEELIPITESATTSTVSGVTSVNAPLLAAAIRVFPLPARDLLHIDADQIRIDQAWLFDSAGARAQAPFSQNNLDLSRIPAGVYVLRLLTAEGLVNLKIVKQ